MIKPNWKAQCKRKDQMIKDMDDLRDALHKHYVSVEVEYIKKHRRYTFICVLILVFSLMWSLWLTLIQAF